MHTWSLPEQDRCVTTLEAKAAKLLPGRFTLLSLPAEKMPPVYRSADVFLHLSKEEAFGNVYLEAMACGLPIVARDSRGHVGSWVTINF